MMTKGAVLMLLTAVFVAVVGNYHFVYGRDIGLRKIEKVSWSLSETLINADEVQSLPAIAVRVRYPLLMKAAEDLAE